MDTVESGTPRRRRCLQIRGKTQRCLSDGSVLNLARQMLSVCMSSGITGRIARLHPKSIRNSRDQAKLISSNDTEGYTFTGRFLDAEQAASLGYIASQKAHSALRWLIARQGYPNGDQAIVAWAVSGKPIPRVVADSEEVKKKADEEIFTTARTRNDCCDRAL